jgi:hypothetical protein
MPASCMLYTRIWPVHGPAELPLRMLSWGVCIIHAAPEHVQASKGHLTPFSPQHTPSPTLTLLYTVASTCMQRTHPKMNPNF